MSIASKILLSKMGVRERLRDYEIDLKGRSIAGFNITKSVDLYDDVNVQSVISFSTQGILNLPDDEIPTQRDYDESLYLIDILPIELIVSRSVNIKKDDKILLFIRSLSGLTSLFLTITEEVSQIHFHSYESKFMCALYSGRDEVVNPWIDSVQTGSFGMVFKSSVSSLDDIVSVPSTMILPSSNYQFLDEDESLILINGNNAMGDNAVVSQSAIGTRRVSVQFTNVVNQRGDFITWTPEEIASS